MVRVGKKKNGGRKSKNYEPVNSDSENDHYGDNFDPNNPFDDDEIEKFHNDRDKILLNGTNGAKKSEYVESSDEEGVLAFDDSDEDSDDDDAADTKDPNDDELITTSWGNRKSAYYSGNRIRNEEEADMEEEEARLLQAKMMKELDTNDFGLDAFQPSSRLRTSDELEAQRLAEVHFGRDQKLDDESIEKVIKNLSKMSTKEKIDFLKQESPELFELVRDFEQKIEELETTLLPIYRHIKQGNGFQPSMATEYIQNKTKMYLMYCSHLSFYFILKSKRMTIENHPIVKNILQYRNIEKIDKQLENEVNFIKGAIESGRQLSFMKPDLIGRNKLKKSVKFRQSESLAFDDDDNNDDVNDEKEPSNETNEITKRAINYEIEKNKGLTPKRPKEYRNPRVRNRLKARKAQIKHRKIVPKVRSQETRYGGEATGIRTGVVRAVKIK